MALIIDDRLLEPNGEPEITENFNRVLNIIDNSSGSGSGAGSGGGIPDATDASEGDVLTINEDGGMEWKTPAEPPTEIPPIEDANEGDVLSVNASGELEFKTPASGLPTVTTSDAGKFLTVNASGEWAAVSVPIADDMTF